jgi:hypothetical protein
MGGGMKKFAIIAIAGILLACHEPKPNRATQERIFKECLAGAPKLPQGATHYSDADEIINSCRTAAYYMSLEP